MYKFALAPVIAFFLFVAAPQARADVSDTKDDAIGLVAALKGSASVTPPHGKAEAARTGTQVHMHDVISTGKGSKLLVKFIDGTQLTLSENAKMTVDEYVFDPKDKADNKARYSVLSGAFQYVSGLISKKPNPDIAIQTSYGTLGIRGTKLWSGWINGSFGIYVSDGKVYVVTSGGDALLLPGLGTHIHSHGGKPDAPAPWPPELIKEILASVNLPGANSGNIQQLLEKYLKHLRQHHKHEHDDGSLPLDDDIGHDIFTPDFDTDSIPNND